MKEHYPYRFKTKSEFENEFGEDWRRQVSYKFPDNMDIILGLVYPYFVDKSMYDFELPNYSWFMISWDMLTENIKIHPNYKSKKIERVL